MGPSVFPVGATGRHSLRYDRSTVRPPLAPLALDPRGVVDEGGGVGGTAGPDTGPESRVPRQSTRRRPGTLSGKSRWRLTVKIPEEPSCVRGRDTVKRRVIVSTSLCDVH